MKKKCTACKEFLEEIEFDKNRSKISGLNSECKKCRRKHRQKEEVKNNQRKYSKTYYQKPEVKERRKEYYQIPEQKAKKREYFKRPEVIDRRKKYLKKYDQKPEVIEGRKEYYQRPEVKERIKRYYSKNRDKILKRQKDWRNKNYEKILKCQKKYRDTHKIERRNAVAKWRKENPEKDKIMKKKAFDNWRRNNHERFNNNLRISNRKRRAIKNHIEERFTDDEWKFKLINAKGFCSNCKKEVGIKNLEQDHIYPLSKAEKDFKRTGKKRIYTINDIQPLCKKCNISKGNKIVVTTL